MLVVAMGGEKGLEFRAWGVDGWEEGAGFDYLFGLSQHPCHIFMNFQQFWLLFRHLHDNYM